MISIDKEQLRTEVRAIVNVSLLTDLCWYSYDVMNPEHRKQFRQVVDAKTDYIMKCIDQYVTDGAA